MNQEPKILKIQLPITSTGKPVVMVYNEDKTVFYYYPYTKELKQFMGKLLFKYVNAYANEKQLFIINETENLKW